MFYLADAFTVIKGHLNGIVFELIRKIMKQSLYMVGVGVLLASLIKIRRMYQLTEKIN